MKVDTSVEIKRPIEEVFAYVADPSTAPKYSSTWVESSLSGVVPCAWAPRSSASPGS